MASQRKAQRHMGKQWVEYIPSLFSLCLPGHGIILWRACAWIWQQRKEVQAGAYTRLTSTSCLLKAVQLKCRSKVVSIMFCSQKSKMLTLEDLIGTTLFCVHFFLFLCLYLRPGTITRLTWQAHEQWIWVLGGQCRHPYPCWATCPFTSPQVGWREDRRLVLQTSMTGRNTLSAPGQLGKDPNLWHFSLRESRLERVVYKGREKGPPLPEPQVVFTSEEKRAFWFIGCFQGLF